MQRGSRVTAVASAVGLAVVGVAIGDALAGGPGALIGAVIGPLAVAFAPPFYDAVRASGKAWRRWQQAVEQPVAVGAARLLDPRRALVGFVGRDEELAALTAWCEDDDASTA